MPASARVMTSATNGLRGAMKPSTSVRGLSAICGAAASLWAFGDGATAGEKLRGALTAGAALTPGLKAEAADETYRDLTSAAALSSATIRGPWTALRPHIRRGAKNVGTGKAAEGHGSACRAIVMASMVRSATM